MRSKVLFFLSFLALGWLRADEVADIRRLLEASPDRPALYDRLGLALVRAGDMSNAEAAFRKSVKLDRAYGRGWYNLGVLEVVRGRQEDALHHWILAVTMDTNDAWAWMNLGNLFNLRNDPLMAERYYVRAWALAPKDPDLLSNMGVLALKRGDAEKAVRLLEEAYALKPDEDILFNLAVALAKAGRRERLQELRPVLSGGRHEADLLRLWREE